MVRRNGVPRRGDDGRCPLGDRGTNYTDTIRIKAGEQCAVRQGGIDSEICRKKAQKSQKEEERGSRQPAFF